MSNSRRHVLRLIPEVMRLVRTGRLSVRWVVGLLILAAIYLALQPMLVRSLGVDLLGIGDLARLLREEPVAAPVANRGDDRPQPFDLEQVWLEGGTYESPAGLIYGRGSLHGHRLKHLMAHTADQPDRPGYHGVFDSQNIQELVVLVDEAFHLAQLGKRTSEEHEAARTVYTVDMGREIGYLGGKAGSQRGHPRVRHLRLVVEDDEFITAFPCRP